MSIAEIGQCMQRKNVNEFLIHELRENGLGSELVKEANEYKNLVTTKNFLTWLHV